MDAIFIVMLFCNVLCHYICETCENDHPNFKKGGGKGVAFQFCSRISDN